MWPGRSHRGCSSSGSAGAGIRERSIYLRLLRELRVPVAITFIDSVPKCSFRRFQIDSTYQQYSCARSVTGWCRQTTDQSSTADFELYRRALRELGGLGTKVGGASVVSVSRHGRVTSLLVAGQCPRFVQDNHHLKGFDWSQSLYLCNEDYSCELSGHTAHATTCCHLVPLVT